jgi:hypothetical protein
MLGGIQVVAIITSMHVQNPNEPSLGELVESLFDQLKRTDDRLAELREEATFATRWRAQVLGRLKQIVPVAEIAARRGVTPAAIYALIQGAEPTAHRAEPVELPGGSWIVDCPICGRVGVGPVLASRKLAQELAEFHNALLTPGAAGDYWNRKESLR